MDAPATTAAPPPRYNRLLPYLAVLRTDVRLTLGGWLYRIWVLVSLAAAVGYGLYSFGIHREAGIVQSASAQTGVLLHGVAAATLGFVSLLAVTAVSGERNTVADAVLSRGISRYQYFLAKWHARTLVAVGTFVPLAAGVLAGYHYLLEPDLALAGCVTAVLCAAAVLAAVAAWGVTVGALAKGTVIGVTLYWLVLFGLLAAASYLPGPLAGGGDLLAHTRAVLRGGYDEGKVSAVVAAALVLAAAGGMVGLVGFRKKDV